MGSFFYKKMHFFIQSSLSLHNFCGPDTVFELHKFEPIELELQKNEPSKLELHKLEPITKMNSMVLGMIEKKLNTYLKSALKTALKNGLRIYIFEFFF